MAAGEFLSGNSSTSTGGGERGLKIISIPKMGWGNHRSLPFRVETFSSLFLSSVMLEFFKVVQERKGMRRESLGVGSLQALLLLKNCSGMSFLKKESTVKKNSGVQLQLSKQSQDWASGVACCSHCEREELPSPI